MVWDDYEHCLRCSSYTGANVSDIIWEKLCQTKISDFWHEISVKKNITSFDISMDNGRIKFLVKKHETPGSP